MLPVRFIKPDAGIDVSRRADEALYIAILDPFKAGTALAAFDELRESAK